MVRISGITQAADTLAPIRPGGEVTVPTQTPTSTAALVAGLVLVIGVALWLWYRRRRTTL